ncbi:AAA-like domain-containing protein [Nostoc sp. GT001]|uniref:AAA-like domain-containing protein n=1 Tax=Nostoc sp. GT001 TaxID=3056647 RepID=UPI0025AB3C5A|nr:AAA-like domain-containing protein [Nostoc sp. GT001]MDM9580217.1 AAA-like domain-containing protein [Nostoc sp. GT001]
MVDQYIFSGSLPENASTYVIREADAQLYEGLKAGKFCYVLNSRQSGKSSLRVRTMQRLREDGVECAAVDLSAGGIQNVPPEQWYADLIDTLIDSFGLDLDFGDWWEANQLNSLVTRFRKFLEEVLLVEVQDSIVIFVDEIDSVLSLNFPTDDFFALIRACYNKRVDNPEYNRLTFCLLGVASPSNLISDKQRTPFNIGKAISLKGFQLHEAEPLEKGLQGKFNNPQAIIQEILQWTGGQPFLTQKLCQFMVEESEQDNPRSIEQVVRSRIIENWESLDEPEHLRTIQARILRDEQRAGYLLELYQQVRLSEKEVEIIADDTLEQSELQLSGLVVRQQGKLRIYNQIYREIFDFNWIENQLNNLRPYSENFRFWVVSGGADESRLLRGKALQEAEEWARDKNLSYQDKQYLAASKEKEIQGKITVQEQEAAFERERKDKEAVEERNQLLSEANRKDREALEQRNELLSKANKKAQGLIRSGTVILILTVFGTAISVTMATLEVKEAQKKLQETYTYVAYPKQLKELSEKLSEKGLSEQSTQIQEKANIKIKDYQLEQVYLHATKSLAYQYLKDWESAKEAMKQSINFLKGWEYNKNERENLEPNNEFLQTNIFALSVEGNLLRTQDKTLNQAKETYQDAFILLQKHPQLKSFQSAPKIIDNKIVKSVHRNLIELLSKNNKELEFSKKIELLPKNNTELEFKKQVEASLTEYLYVGLVYYLKNKDWESADQQTDQLMLNIAKREEQGYLDYSDINRFSCPDLQKIDKLWFNTDNRFGFRVQKEIWISTAQNYFQFAKTVGWYAEKASGDNRGSWVSYTELIKGIKDNAVGYRGSLPTMRFGGGSTGIWQGA